MSLQRKKVRVEQTLSTFERLQEDFLSWKKRRDLADQAKKQYQTQLNALKTAILQAVKNISEDLRTIEIKKIPTGEVYQHCHLHDKRALWIRRTLWGFYRQKFDQRDNQNYRQVLECADDLLWSCYKEALDNASVKRIPPIPLAYIEPHFSPQALQRDKPPGLWSYGQAGDKLLEEYFKQLPIPVVSLPPIVANAPWWLIYIGHEAGHHIQHDLGLVSTFGEYLKEVAQLDPEPKETAADATRWMNWGEEIFADSFSVYMMGSAAVWALAELTRTKDIFMLRRNTLYPPSIVRLVFMAKLLDDLLLQKKAGEPPPASTPGKQSLEDLEPDSLVTKPVPNFENIQSLAKADLAMTEKMVTAINKTKQENGIPSIRSLAGWNKTDFSPGGEVYRWKQALMKNQIYQVPPSLKSARMITCGAIECWREIISAKNLEIPLDLNQSENNTALKAARNKLNDIMLTAIEAHRDIAVRASDETILKDVSQISVNLSNELRNLDFSEW